MSDKPKSYGRKSIRPTAIPRSLMDGDEELAGVWQARIMRKPDRSRVERW